MYSTRPILKNRYRGIFNHGFDNARMSPATFCHPSRKPSPSPKTSRRSQPQPNWRPSLIPPWDPRYRTFRNLWSPSYFKISNSFIISPETIVETYFLTSLNLTHIASAASKIKEIPTAVIVIPASIPLVHAFDRSRFVLVSCCCHG